MSKHTHKHTIVEPVRARCVEVDEWMDERMNEWMCKEMNWVVCWTDKEEEQITKINKAGTHDRERVYNPHSKFLTTQ